VKSTDSAAAAATTLIRKTLRPARYRPSIVHLVLTAGVCGLRINSLEDLDPQNLKIGVGTTGVTSKAMIVVSLSATVV